MNDEQQLSRFFASLRWQLACVGWFAQVPLVLFFKDWPFSVRAAVAVAVLLRAVLFSRAYRLSTRAHVLMLLGSFAVDLTLKALTIGAIYPEHPGAYLVFYFGLTYLWAGGLILARNWGLHLAPTLAPAVFVATAGLPGHHFLTTLADYWFLYLATWWATLSLTAYLRRSQQDLSDAANYETLGTHVRQDLERAVAADPDHEIGCRARQTPPAAPLPAPPLSYELLLLVRRRSLRHQFTEWRARDPLVERVRLAPDAHRSLAQWIDVNLASEPSPLSLRLTTRSDDLHLSTKAAHSALSTHDLPDANVGRSEIVSTRFGRVVSIRARSADLDLTDRATLRPDDEQDGGARPTVVYLNDIVGGGVAGDNYRFGRTLVWIMTLYPISVAIQQVFLVHPPGRPETSALWLRVLSFAALSIVGLSAVVSVRKKEAVTTRRSWLWSLFAAYSLILLIFAALDTSNAFWTSPSGGWRYLHPFLGFGLLLTALMSIWLAHAPLPFGLSINNSHSPDVAAGSLMWHRRGLITMLAAVSSVLPIVAAVTIAGARSGKINAVDFVEQVGLWAAPFLATVVAAYLILRPLFDLLSDEAFAFQAFSSALPDGEPAIADGCAEQCSFRARRKLVADQWGNPRSVVPDAVALLGGQSEFAQRPAGKSLAVVTQRSGSPLLEMVGILDRVLLLEGHGPVDVRVVAPDHTVITFEPTQDSYAAQYLRSLLLRRTSWVLRRDRWLDGLEDPASGPRRPSQ